MKNFGTPQHSYKYFLNLFKKLKKGFKGLNCYKDKRLIGSIIILYTKNYSYLAFSISDSKHSKYRPNDLLHWEIIKWASKNNIKYFDIGQCESNSEKGNRAEGIYRFKKKWLGKIYDRNYFYYYFDKKENVDKKNKKKDKLKKIRVIWRKIPSAIINIIGPKIASQLGI